LVADVQVATLVHDYEIIQTIIIEVRYSRHTSTVERLREQTAAVGELRPGSGHRTQSENSRCVKSFHEFYVMLGLVLPYWFGQSYSRKVKASVPFVT
jgi:hypothetical protein